MNPPANRAPTTDEVRIAARTRPKQGRRFVTMTVPAKHEAAVTALLAELAAGEPDGPTSAQIAFDAMDVLSAFPETSFSLPRLDAYTGHSAFSIAELGPDLQKHLGPTYRLDEAAFAGDVATAGSERRGVAYSLTAEQADRWRSLRETVSED